MMINNLEINSHGTISDFSCHLLNTAEDKLRFLRLYSLHHLSCLLLNPAAIIFQTEPNCGVGYTIHKRVVIVIGGIMAPTELIEKTGGIFLAWCTRKKLTPLFVHLSQNDRNFLIRRGFRINQIGASYSLSFNKFTATGKKYRQVRRKLNNALRSGVTAAEITTQSEFHNIRDQLVAINKNWLKGKKAKKIRILVSEFDNLSFPSDEHKLFIARHGGKITSYIVFSRTYGKEAGWFHNLSRRNTGCVDGTMQLMVTKFLETLENETLHFGFTPLVEMNSNTINGSHSFSKIARFLSNRGGVVYPARAQRQYKVSWNPNQVKLEYFSYKGLVLPRVLNLLVLTNSL